MAMRAKLLGAAPFLNNMPRVDEVIRALKQASARKAWCSRWEARAPQQLQKFVQTTDSSGLRRVGFRPSKPFSNQAHETGDIYRFAY